MPMPKSHLIPILRDNQAKISYRKPFLCLPRQLMEEVCLPTESQTFTNRILNSSTQEFLLKILIIILTVFLHLLMSPSRASMKQKVHLENHWLEEIKTKLADSFHNNRINGIIISNSQMKGCTKMMTLFKHLPMKFIDWESTMHK